MGPKKRNIASGSKSSKPPATSSTTAAAVDCNAIKLECERALTVLRQGNHTKALKLMKDLCSKHENSPFLAFIHHVLGDVCVKITSNVTEPNAKQRHLKNAVESARKSVMLSPNSIEFSRFYANLLFETANEGKEYEGVVQECERALAIENPTDPTKETLQEENYHNISSAEARVAHVQNELRSLIKKSNIASVSTGMKNLGSEEVKFGSIPMESRSVKKANKTPEERRKEIEVRVTAARILQHKFESPQCSNIDSNKGLDSSSGKVHRVGERRKSGNMRRNISSIEIRDQVRSYWNSMDLDSKKELLRVRISDLKAYFSLLKEEPVSKVLDEALSFWKENKVWKFWLCYRCNKKYADADTHRQHTIQEHMGTLLREFQLIIPNRVENEWAEMLLNCSWKPLDLDAAIKMLKEGSKLGDSSSGNNKDDSSPGKKQLGDENQAHEKSLLCKSWPSTDDSNCAWLLEKIQAKFQQLIHHKYLASSSLHQIIHYAVEVLQRLPDCSQLLNSGMDQTPLCICFLGAPELKKILCFLLKIEGEIFQFEERNFMDDSTSGTQSVNTMEKITSNLDDLVLELDDGFLGCRLNSSSCDDDSSSATSLYVCYENDDAILDSDALMTRIFTGPLIGEVVVSWTSAREEKAQQGKEILELREKKFNDLQSLCRRKYDHLNYLKAMNDVNSLCCEESFKREHVVDSVPQRYGSVLRKRLEELIGSGNRITIIKNGFERAAIENVLKDAESGNDSSIIYAIQRKKHDVSLEASKVDARMLQVVNSMQQLEVKLDPASAYDFRSILVPLVKSYLQAHLEDLAEKEAKKKSDAASEALLAELAFDSEQVFGNSEHMHKRMKDKKRRKENRKNKDSKATGGNELLMIHDQTSEEISHISPPDGDDPNAAIAFAGTSVDLRQQHMCSPGLKNEVGEYNCFLNVIIQSLWHLQRFQVEFLRSTSGHVHVGVPCVICALCDIFISLSTPPIATRREAVAPTSLRIALSNLYPDSNFFQEGQMNDASEVLGVIFDCLHQSFPCAPPPVLRFGSFECTGLSCIAHSLFGMEIFERMKCDSCSLESRHLNYKSFFRNINASALRTMKVMYPENSFDELLNLIEMNHQLACDPEAGGCGKLNYIHPVLSAQPHVFVAVLGWQNTCESVDNVTATLAALSTEIDISVLYRGLDPKSTHCLVSMVCFYGQHYCCFAYKHEYEQWIMYDDETVEEIGGWNDVLTMCEGGHLQPQVLFFEAAS